MSTHSQKDSQNDVHVCTIYINTTPETVWDALTTSVFGKVAACFTAYAGQMGTQTQAVVWELVPLSTNKLETWPHLIHAVSVVVEHQCSWACLQDAGLSLRSLSRQLAS